MNEELLQKYAEVVGTDNLLTQPEQLQPYETATYETTETVKAVLKPESAEQVQALVKLANEFKDPLYPISSGKNWGYGSAVPTADGCTILDLSLMRNIVKFDPDLAYVTVEPGVTQKQLYDFLQQQGGKLWMDATGSSQECSIIGNTMERGFGHTPYGDHFANVSGLEVVLANGECFKTGFARFANAQAAEVYHWGVGPYLDGLFSQSSFAVVTQMTIWLMPKPAYFQAFFCSVDKADFGPMVDALRPLRLDGTLKSAMHLVNGDKVVSAFDQYPWQAMEEATPLSREWLAQRLKQLDAKEWNASGALYGTWLEVAVARRKIKQALKHIPSHKIKFLDDTLLRVARLVQTPYQWVTGFDLKGALDKSLPVYHLKQGVPTNAFIPSTYWRKKQPPPEMDAAHPDRDKCGLLWLAPVAPMTGEHATRLEHLVYKYLLEYGFEPAISMTLLTERCIDCVICITYDRENAEQEKQALACHDALFSALTSEGYFPYRLSTRAMTMLPAAAAGYLQVVRGIKQTLDPNMIFSPGRYQE
ncbi:FAD-dependent oxidoreductase [Motilimonas sp. KMU-193]|uniref:FAD-binding oxidoreductase n=1 Tax=Motilimonas sp. KMU-193 TaxID=3388668 RepID=UPI00396B28DA